MPSAYPQTMITVMQWFSTGAFLPLCDLQAVGLANRLRGPDLPRPYPHAIRRRDIVALPLPGDTDRNAEWCDRRRNVARPSQDVHRGEATSFRQQALGSVSSCAPGR